MATKLKLVTKEQAYKPSFANKRVQDRIATVIAWCSANLSEAWATQVHSKTLTEVFGNQGQDLPRYLRYKLLQQEGSYAAGVESFSYRLKPNALNDLAQAAGVAGSMFVTSIGQSEADRLKARFKDELETGQFVYHRSSERDWHPLQNIPNERRPEYTGPIKSEFWRDMGMPWNYDIVACAPNILTQLALKAGVPALAIEAITLYLDDRKGFRRHVAVLCGVPDKTAKKIVTGLFNGARLVAHGKCAVYAMVGYDRDALDRLVNDPEVQRLRSAIKIMWRRLDTTFKAGLKAQGLKKWSLYFACERKVMDVVAGYLSSRDNKFFAEHDGFRASRQIDVHELSREVEARTKFKLTFEQSEK